MIRFTIPGEVVPQLRPRFARQGGGVRTYDPQKCRSYKNYVAAVAGKHCTGQPIEGPVAVTIRIYKKIPPSWPRAKRAAALAGGVLPTGRPDLDNLAKGICDALKGIAWKDDAQIVVLTAEKRYDSQQRAEIEIREVADESIA